MLVTIEGLSWSALGMDMAKLVHEYGDGFVSTANLNHLFQSMAMLLLLTIEDNSFSWMRLERQPHVPVGLPRGIQLFEREHSIRSSLSEHKAILATPSPNHMGRMSWRNGLIIIYHEPLIATVVSMVNWEFVIMMILAHSAVELVVGFVGEFDVISERVVNNMDPLGFAFIVKVHPVDVVCHILVCMALDAKSLARMGRERESCYLITLRQENEPARSQELIEVRRSHILKDK